jgi:hypothetical protein
VYPLASSFGSSSSPIAITSGDWVCVCQVVTHETGTTSILGIAQMTETMMCLKLLNCNDTWSFACNVLNRNSYTKPFYMLLNTKTCDNAETILTPRLQTMLLEEKKTF